MRITTINKNGAQGFYGAGFRITSSRRPSKDRKQNGNITISENSNNGNIDKAGWVAVKELHLSY